MHAVKHCDSCIKADCGYGRKNKSEAVKKGTFLLQGVCEQGLQILWLNTIYCIIPWVRIPKGYPQSLSCKVKSSWQYPVKSRRIQNRLLILSELHGIHTAYENSWTSSAKSTEKKRFPSLWLEISLLHDLRNTQHTAAFFCVQRSVYNDVYLISFTYCRISAALLAGLAFSKVLMITPSSSMTYVERVTPI